ncbi:MAG: hypothetical protein AB8B56_10290, partial [Crocinitomicaceae bacterium]
EIVNGENGLLVPVDITSKNLSDNIREFIESTDDAQEKKRKAALATWESNYNSELNYTKFALRLTQMEG